jgi:phosphatidylserine decarboxylase
MSHFSIIVQHLTPQHLLSRIVGIVASTRIGWIKNLFISTIIRIFDVDMTEAERGNYRDYDTFNDFFTRTLKPGARDFSGLVSSPADGVVSACGNITDSKLFQAKSKRYTLEKLLANAGAAEKFRHGSFATIYLSPKDYHRVHCPIAGSLQMGTYVPGKLFSVNKKTTEAVDDLFAINERYVMHFDTKNGAMVVIMVGAMIVAGIRPAWQDKVFPARMFDKHQFVPPKIFAQGDELGSFLMGSTAIVLFEHQVDWNITPNQSVKLGESLVNTVDQTEAAPTL